jgi:hypothetical protein
MRVSAVIEVNWGLGEGIGDADLFGVGELAGIFLGVSVIRVGEIGGAD